MICIYLREKIKKGEKKERESKRKMNKVFALPRTFFFFFSLKSVEACLVSIKCVSHAYLKKAQSSYFIESCTRSEMNKVNGTIYAVLLTSCAQREKGSSKRQSLRLGRTFCTIV